MHFFVFKLKIISYVILFTSLFTILSGCSGRLESITSSGEENSSDPVIEKESIPFRFRWAFDDRNQTTAYLPLVKDYKYNFTINWGDGRTSTITSYNDPDRIHPYAKIGTYQVVIE